MNGTSAPAAALVIGASTAELQAVAAELSEAAPLRITTVLADDAAAELRQASQRGAPPELVFFGPQLDNAVGLARALRAQLASSHLFFIRLEAASGSAQVLPGLRWSILTPQQLPASSQIAEALATIAQRRRFTTTLRRANQQLSQFRAEPRQSAHQPALSDYYLRSFLVHAQDAVVALDAAGKVLYWSAGAAALLGLDEIDSQGAPASSLPFWTPQLDELVRTAATRAQTSMVESRFERRARRLTLETVGSAVRDEFGKLIGTALIIRDVSARAERLAAERARQQQAEHSLDTELRYLKSLFEQAPGFIAVTRGSDHVFEIANQAYLRLFGGRDVLGQPAAQALPELQGQAFLRLLDKVHERRKAYMGRSMPVSVQRQSDAPAQTLYVDFVFQPITAPDGSISGIFCQGADVTEHRLTQQKLTRHQRDLEQLVRERTQALQNSQRALHQSQKLEAIGKLTGGVAHDFNNVLQIISSSLQLLRMNLAQQPAEVHTYLELASDAVQRGSRLSSHLLAFARRQPLRPAAVNLRRILRRMDDLLRHALGETIAIETNVAADLWVTMADPHQLENVILNLAINARDAMPEGGKLTLELGNAHLDERYVQPDPDLPAGQYVVLAVSDTGTGMPAEIVERVFEPFFTTKNEGEGTGLGLSMAYGFAKQSGGHIRIYSESGHGTTVRMYLPRSLEQEAELPRSPDLAVTGGQETILVVEDDPAVRETAVLILSQLGYNVLQAHDGQSGLNVLNRGHPIDLLFTDVVMPGKVRSTELARLAERYRPGIAVLFTSGYTQNAIVHGGRLDPGVELLSKPYNHTDLARKVRELLDQRPSTDSAPRARALEVLVVEDDQANRLAVCELLRLLGHEPVGVVAAEPALAALSERRFDLLLTDVNLPQMSGLELAHRATASWPRLSVVVASGYGASLAQATPEHWALLPKPFDLQALTRAIATATRGCPNS